jgi:hypothetical protein
MIKDSNFTSLAKTATRRSILLGAENAQSLYLKSSGLIGQSNGSVSGFEAKTVGRMDFFKSHFRYLTDTAVFLTEVNVFEVSEG